MRVKWTVEDDATGHLMAGFYANLWEKRLPPAEAMRQAQLALIRGEGINPPPIDRGPGSIVPGAARGRRRQPPAGAGRLDPRLWAGWAVSGISGL